MILETGGHSLEQALELLRSGEYGEARQILRAVAKEEDIHHSLPALVVLGECCDLLAESREADAVYGHVERIARTSTEVLARGEALAGLAAHFARRGFLRQALATIGEVHCDGKAAGTQQLATRLEWVRGEIFEASGMPGRARRSYCRSARAARACQDHRLLARAYVSYACCRGLGANRALKIGAAALRHAEAHADRHVLVRMEVALGNLHLQTGHPDQALALAGSALEHAATPRLKAEAALLLSSIFHRAGDIQQAARWARKAAVAAGERRDDELALRIAQSKALIAVSAGDLLGALDEAFKATAALTARLRNMPFAAGIGVLTEAHLPLVKIAALSFQALSSIYGRSFGRFAILDHLGRFFTVLEAVRCTRIRELLRLFVSSVRRGGDVDSEWIPGPPTPEGIAPAPLTGPRQPGIRGRSPGRRESRSQEPPLVEGLEATPEELEEKGQILFPAVDRIEGFEGNTILLHLSFTGDDLIIAPAQLIGGRSLMVEGIHEGLIVIPGIRPRLEGLAERQSECLDRFMFEYDGQSASELHRLCPLRELYAELAAAIELPRVLSLLEERTEGLGNQDMVIFPSGPLLRFPLHAAVVNERGVRLCERVRSLRYSPSLSVLLLQARTRSRRVPGAEALRVLIMANPETGTDLELPAVRDEVEDILKLLQDHGCSWRVHCDGPDPRYRATLANLRRWHSSADILWLAGHGEPRAGFRLCDGSAGPEELFRGEYDFSGIEIVVVSACLLGQMSGVDRHRGDIEALNAILALRGCRRVVSAMWPIEDECARVFGKELMARMPGLPGGRPRVQGNGYACALRDALARLRSVDGGRYDHEIFWAPYWLWGLG